MNVCVCICVRVCMFLSVCLCVFISLCVCDCGLTLARMQCNAFF